MSYRVVMSRIVFVFLAVVVTAVVVLYAIEGANEHRKGPGTIDLSEAFQNQLVAFNASNPSPDDAKALDQAQTRFREQRERGVGTVAAKTRARTVLDVVAHLLSGAVLVVAFWIAFVGASKGIQISGTPSNEQLKRLGKLRKSVLVFSAASAFCAGAADRVAAFSAKLNADARDAVALINKADDELGHALGPKDIDAATNRLELSLAAL